MLALRTRWFLSRRKEGAKIRRATQLASEGDQARDRRDWVGASRLYRQVLDIAPQLTNIWVQYGHALKEQGALSRAEFAYRKAIALDDRIADTYLQLGHLMKVSGNDVGAAKAYLHAAIRDPNLLDAKQELRTLGYSDSDIEDNITNELSLLESGSSSMAQMDAVEMPFRSSLQLNALQRRLSELNSDWRRHGPALINAAATLPALAHAQSRIKKDAEALSLRLAAADNQTAAHVRSIADLWETSARHDREIADLRRGIETLGREVLFGRKLRSHLETQLTDTPRVVSAEKLAGARDASSLRLNISCGHVVQTDYINVATRRLPGIDVVADLGLLPVGERSVDELCLQHLIESLPEHDLRHRLLPYWISRLKPGGRFRVVARDGNAMFAHLSGNGLTFEHFRAVLFGEHARESQVLCNLFTPESLAGLLLGVGLIEPQTSRERSNGVCFEFEIIAHRPFDPPE